MIFPRKLDDFKLKKSYRLNSIIAHLLIQGWWHLFKSFEMKTSFITFIFFIAADISPFYFFLFGRYYVVHIFFPFHSIVFVRVPIVLGFWLLLLFIYQMEERNNKIKRWWYCWCCFIFIINTADGYHKTKVVFRINI